ncbi:hypothetical protein DCAR_0103607 [Daucus carota subsp. sativus]|uniref:Uncharacterized protein n=1 Tax=Daucus carota subsp. sativus TaxID=79200 RepID=A0A166I4R2_DAUCS|nr:hypothetical protein DCAR_0103607 [Daucus carota subsp. sativus]
MRIFGKLMFPGRFIILSASGMLVLAATTYDIHRSIKNNSTPPTQQEMQELNDYIKSLRPPS